MHRPPSVAIRIVRSLVALVTIWCTGCAGFEPVLNAIAGQGVAIMSCASESMQESNPSAAPSGTSASVVAEGSASASAAVSATLGASSQRDFSCGCSQCHAVTLARAVVPTLQLATPSLVTRAPIALVSVGRAPLLPPPERIAL